MGMSRTHAIPLVLAPDLRLVLRVRNASAKPDVGTVVRNPEGTPDSYVFVTDHLSMREDDTRWRYRRIIWDGRQYVLGTELVLAQK